MAHDLGAARFNISVYFQVYPIFAVLIIINCKFADISSPYRLFDKNNNKIQ